LLLLHEALAPGRVFFYRDILGYWVPQVESLVRAVGQGSWPLWNPYFAFGSPMLADASTQVFYPTTWLNLLLLPATYYKVLIVSHMAVAGLGTYRLARRYDLPPLPACLAAALWLASGPYLSLASLYHHFVSVSWLPWLLLRLEDLLEAPVARNAARLALIAALQLLGGSGDMCLMSGLAAALRIGARLASSRPRACVRVLGWTGLAGLLGCGVAAAQWLPTLALVAGSGRSGMTAEARAFWSLSPLAALDMLLPRLIADAPLSDASRAWLFEGREPFVTFLYLGVATVPLAAAGVAGFARSRAWLVLAALLFLCLALGRFNPWYATLVNLPPFGLIRFPVKYVVPFCFFWCLLAGRGLHEWRQERRDRWAALLAWSSGLALLLAAATACLLLADAKGGAFSAGLMALVQPLPDARWRFLAAALRASAGALAVVATSVGLLSLRGTNARGAAATLVAALALADLARVTVAANPGAPAALLQHAPPVVSRLRSTSDAPRLFALGVTPDQLARGPENWDAEARWSLGLLESLRAPAAARFLISGSYDGDFTGLAPGTMVTLSDLAGRYLGQPLGLRLLQLGAVDYVLALGHAPQTGLRELPPPLASVFKAPLRVYEVPSRLPRAYVVSRARVADEPASYLALADPGFDPTREVVLAPGAAGAAGAQAGEPVAGRARLLERRMDRLLLEAQLASPGYLVVVEAYDPAWRVSVDGRPAPLLRANVAFRAVALEAGRHTVEMTYRPRAAPWGLLVSVGACAAAALLAARRA
jgi:hypothetical protein